MAPITPTPSKRALGALALAGAGAAAAATKAALSRRNGGGDVASGRSRAYRLKRGERPAEGIVRIAEGRVDDALEQLRGAKKRRDRDAAVHEARKDLKKIRSVLRLVRDDLGDSVYRRENVRFRDAARGLSGARDAEVKLKTLSSLRERFAHRLSDTRLTALVDALETEREQHARLADSALERVVAEIEAGRAAIADWPLKANDWSLLEPGIRRSYRRGRNRFADLRDEVSDEAVHEWRKRVKDHWYHLRLVRDAWKPVLAAAADEAHELSDLLGDHHDLAVLRDHAIELRELLSGDELERLLGSISERQDQLAGDALPLGERVYAEKPKQLTERVRSYWLAWR
jgi:CHAD domain-containing protein